jgi:hypothetical protein
MGVFDSSLPFHLRVLWGKGEGLTFIGDAESKGYGLTTVAAYVHASTKKGI